MEFRRVPEMTAILCYPSHLGWSVKTDTLVMLCLIGIQSYCTVIQFFKLIVLLLLNPVLLLFKSFGIFGFS